MISEDVCIIETTIAKSIAQLLDAKHTKGTVVSTARISYRSRDIAVELGESGNILIINDFRAHKSNQYSMSDPDLISKVINFIVRQCCATK